MNLKITCSETRISFSKQTNQRMKRKVKKMKMILLAQSVTVKATVRMTDLVLVSCVLCIPYSAVMHLQ